MEDIQVEVFSWAPFVEPSDISAALREQQQSEIRLKRGYHLVTRRAASGE